MADTERKLHSVAPPSEDYRLKIKRHRRRIVMIIAAAILIVAAALFVVYFYLTHKEYKSLEVISTEERSDTTTSEYLSFAGNTLRLTNDGASYTKSDGTLIWNQTFEMDEPKASICGNYTCLYEVGNNTVYIMDNVNNCGTIVTTSPVVRASIASQGTVAILMESEGVSYLHLYDKKGSQLAAGEIHAKNSGYPMDIALSPSGEKLAVSMMDIATGSESSQVVFYNFGNVGQNEIDKIVGTYIYENTIIPQLKYMSDDTLVAFADSGIYLYTGAQRPEQTGHIAISGKIQSVFTGDRKMGVIIKNDIEGSEYRFEVYDTKGRLITEGNFDTDYEHCEFLENGDLCIYSKEDVLIQTMSGVRRLEYKFSTPIKKVFSEISPIRYSFLFDEELRKCRLK